MIFQAAMPRVTPAQNIEIFFTIEGGIHGAQGRELVYEGISIRGEIYYARRFFCYARGKFSMADRMNLCFERAVKGCWAFQTAIPRVTPAQDVNIFHC